MFVWQFFAAICVMAGLNLPLGAAQPIGLLFEGAIQHRYAKTSVPAEVTRLSVSGNWAAVAAGSDGLQLFDMTQPAKPRFVSQMLASMWGGLVAQDVKLSGKMAYVAAERSGLEIIDFSQPDAPQRVGGYRPSGNANAVVLAGSYAYLAAGDAGLYVLDVSNPARVSTAGWYPRSMLDELMASDVRVAGEYAFVVGTKGLTILRLTNPDDIRIRGQVAIAGGATALDLNGSYAYVISSDGSLLVVNVAEPANPALVSRYPTGPNAGRYTHIRIDGTLAYLTCGSNGVQVVDLSNPTEPAPVGGLATFGDAKGITTAGDLVFVAEGTTGLAILRKVSATVALPEVSGPEDQTIAQGATAQFTVSPSAADAVSVQWLFNGIPLDGETNLTLTVTKADSPQAGFYEAAASNAGGSVMSRVARLKPVFPPVFVEQPFDWAVVEGDSFVQRVVVGPEGPFPYPWMLGPFDFQWRLNGQIIPGATNYLLHVETPNPNQAGNYSVSVSNLAGVMISRDAQVMVHPKLTLKPLSQWEQAAYDIQVVGQLLYIACGQEGVQILDPSDVNQPMLAGHIPTQGESRAVRVIGSVAYIADGKEGGLAAVDVSSPGQPKRLSHLVTGETMTALTIVGSHAFVTTRDPDGMTIIDVSDPKNMVQTASVYPKDFHSLEVDANGLFAYVASGTNGCRVYYVGDPSKPIEINRYLFDSQGLTAAVRDVSTVGNYLYMAHGYAGLRALDITDPTTPRELDTEPGYASRFAVVNPYGFAVIENKVSIFNMSFPSLLIKVGSCPVEGLSYAVINRHLFVATGERVIVFELDQTALPNPVPLRMAAEWLRATSQFKLRVNGTAPVILQESENLKNWRSVITNSAPVSENLFEFIQTLNPQPRTRFYRAVQ